MPNGKLVVNAKNQIPPAEVHQHQERRGRDGRSLRGAVPRSLRAVPPKESVRARDVELDWKGPACARSGRWARLFGGTTPSATCGRPASRAAGGGRPESRGQRQRTLRKIYRHRDRRSHNPYNFRAVLPPAQGGSSRTGRPGAGGGHHRYHADCVSGVIRVTITMKTPLLLPDAGCMIDGANDHKTFPVRLDADGKPLVAPTGVKGMLRSAYEVVTNSRMAVFAFRQSDNEDYASGHAVPLAYRMNAGEGLRPVPARIDAGQIRLMMGTTTGFPSWDSRQRFWVVPGPMYAAWLPRYDRGRFNGLTYSGGSIPQHGDPVTCWVVEVNHRSGRFSFWGVRSIFRQGQAQGQCPQDCIQIDGHVCVTNANIDRKHDERIFFVHGQAARSHPITHRLRQCWHDLICNYRREHEEDVAERHRRGQTPDQYLGCEPGRTAWSRHIYQQGAEELTDGTLCYAMLDEHDQVIELFPVMILRRLHEASPSCSCRTHCGPRQVSMNSRRPTASSGGSVSRARVHIAATCVSARSSASQTTPSSDSLATACRWRPLANRRSNKRGSMLAVSPLGEAQADGISKEEAGYQHNKGLRGRKGVSAPRRAA